MMLTTTYRTATRTEWMPVDEHAARLLDAERTIAALETEIAELRRQLDLRHRQFADVLRDGERCPSRSPWSPSA